MAHTVGPTSHTGKDMEHTVELSGYNVEDSATMTNPMTGFSAPMTDAGAVNSIVGVDSTATSGFRPQLPSQSYSIGLRLHPLSTTPFVHSTLPFVHNNGDHRPDPYAILGSYTSVGGRGGVRSGILSSFCGPKISPEVVH